MEVKMPEAVVPKVGHGPKMGQNGFNRACVSVVFLFLLCLTAHPYEANGGTDMEVLACFRPVFFVYLGFLCTEVTHSRLYRELAKSYRKLTQNLLGF